jgi:hypothetical protein
MRRFLITFSLLFVASCTPKLRFQELAQMEGKVQSERSGTKLEGNIAHVAIWYMGNSTGYEYYSYEYDLLSPDGMHHVEKHYRYRDADQDDIHGSWWPAYVGNGRFPLTADRTKWIRYPEGNMSQYFHKPTASRPSTT